MNKIIIPALFALVLTACAPAAPPASNSNPQTEPTASAVSPETTKVYSMDEVAKHAVPEDCWFVIEGKVYDVTGFGEKHSGGEAVYAGCGQDATNLFDSRPMGSGTPHSDNARSFLPNFEIGLLAQ